MFNGKNKKWCRKSYLNECSCRKSKSKGFRFLKCHDLPPPPHKLRKKIWLRLTQSFRQSSSYGSSSFPFPCLLPTPPPISSSSSLQPHFFFFPIFQLTHSIEAAPEPQNDKLQPLLCFLQVFHWRRWWSWGCWTSQLWWSSGSLQRQRLLQMPRLFRSHVAHSWRPYQNSDSWYSAVCCGIPSPLQPGFSLFALPVKE